MTTKDYKNQDRLDKVRKLQIKDAQKQIYEWVKTGTISSREFIRLTNIIYNRLSMILEN